jgi:hypothetical protein
MKEPDAMTNPAQAPQTPSEAERQEQDKDQQAYASLSADRAALAEVARVNVNLDGAAKVVIQVAKSITKEQRDAFASLPASIFNIIHVMQLEARGCAARYVTRKLRQAKALGDDTIRRLPPALSEAATALRAKTLRVLDYHLGTDDAVARQLAAIREGAGFADLANDLDDVADLYDAHAQTLAHDRTHYQASDAATARDLSRQIIEQLDQMRRSDIQRWGDESGRAWTLMSVSYSEVRSAAQFIWRHDPATLAQFTSLRAKP